MASILLVYALGALAFGRPTGLVAALGMALNGSLLLMERTVGAEALYAPLLLAAALALLLALRSGRLPLLLLAGLLLGLGALTRPVAQTMLPLGLALTLLAPAVGGWRGRLAAGALLTIGFLLVVAPWVIRNRVVHGVAEANIGLGDALYARIHRHDRSFTFRDHGPALADPQQARLRRRIFELAEDPEYIRGPALREHIEEEFDLTPEQSDRALREAVLLVVRQEPARYLGGTLLMLGEVLFGQTREKTIDQHWETRFNVDDFRQLPLAVRSGGMSNLPASAEDQAMTAAIIELHRDADWSLVFGLLFLLGTGRCLADPRRYQLSMFSAMVLLQLLLYIGLDGPQSRYRSQFQPLLTLVAAAGLTWFAAWLWHLPVRTWLGRWARTDNPAPVVRAPVSVADATEAGSSAMHGMKSGESSEPPTVAGRCRRAEVHVD